MPNVKKIRKISSILVETKGGEEDRGRKEKEMEQEEELGGEVGDGQQHGPPCPGILIQ